ncbi:MAG: AraC family transcriptional regulator [Pseudomonadota bacterium]
MMYLDLALRGGAVTLLVLLAALLWRAPIGLEGRLSVVALAVTQTAFLIVASAVPMNFGPAVQMNLVLFASLSGVAITWLIVTIFLDAPWRKWPWIVAGMVESTAHYISLTRPEYTAVCLISGVGLFGSLLILSLWSSKDDLVECRCKARPGFAAAIAGMGLFLTGAQATGFLVYGSVQLAIFHSVGTFGLALVFAVWLLRPDASLWPGETLGDQGAPVPTREDPALLARIEAAMAAGIWREEGLTIGALASKLAVPEHRLRRAINQGLGHRNFSSFINRARIDAACKVLSNPAQMNVTVLEIAYDVGFSSVGPFNRAFRAEVGQSPTEYRRATEAGGFADPSKSAPMSANLH